ncbi:nucleotidyltransferase family protein [Corticibacter populi]|uniref:Nucleotidyltransferase family protein n=2 Tax=Corticibacter populi TaxID=1550736 RepID=A0A3M6QKK5_9BURK|nr:nucleotidyltransferase family protein [Corticibacter populi]
MILAAGRGERMRPLTDHTPKPLLAVQGKPLMQWHLEALQAAGIASAVINTGWLGQQVAERWGAGFGTDFGAAHPDHPALALHYSREERDFGGGIETAGGIARALPLLDDSFWLVAGDVFVPQWRFDEALRRRFAAGEALAHLWLVPNPPHHPRGDFVLGADGLARPAHGASSHEEAARTSPPSLTYSTIALLRKALFQPPWCSIPAGNPAGVAAPLGPLLFKAAAAGRVSASLYTGDWTDVGTPERLQSLDLQTPSHGR